MSHRPFQLATIALTAALIVPTVLLAGARDLVIVRPGGPSPSEEAQVQVSRLMVEIAVRAGWEEGSTAAFYFNDATEATAHIEADPPGFLIATPGFFLAQREKLELTAVNQILLDGSATHRYYLVARTGELEGVKQLVGSTLLGSPLAEPEFVERVVLQDRLRFDADVEAGQARALSALRRLSRGQIGAVILDATEHDGLDALPFAGELETIFTSEEIPNTGVFALGGVASPADVEALAAATRDFCREGEGADICATYQISGFEQAPEGVFDHMIRQYQQ